MAKFSEQGYIIMDVDRQLVIRGTQTKTAMLLTENTTQLITRFAHKAFAERCIAENNFKFSRSANTYCQQYRISKKKLRSMWQAVPCTFMLDYTTDE